MFRYAGGMRKTRCQGCRQRDARIAALEKQVAALVAEVRELRARLNQNASNSSVPPSANPSAAAKPVVKEPTGRQPGGQPGHAPYERVRLPIERVKQVVPYLPEACWRCQQPLPSEPGPNDPPPTWHQVVEIPEITAFLNDPNNSGLASGLKPYFDAKDSVFIVYEVWRSSKMEFNSETGTDITTSVKVGEVKPISKAEGSLTVNRTAKEKLSITGDQPYAFAVKLLKLERDPSSGNLSVKLTNFTPPTVTQGPDDQYTFVDENMQGLVVKSVPRIERLSVLK